MTGSSRPRGGYSDFVCLVTFHHDLGIPPATWFNATSSAYIVRQPGNAVLNHLARRHPWFSGTGLWNDTVLSAVSAE